MTEDVVFCLRLLVHLILIIVNKLNHYFLDFLHFFLRATTALRRFLFIVYQVLKLVLRIHHFVFVKVIRGLKECVRAIFSHLYFILACLFFKAKE